MPRIPYGYVVENGVVKIDAEAAAKVRMLYELYASGCDFKSAAAKAGIQTYALAVKAMLSRRCYVGDVLYPAIIEMSLFDQAQKVLLKEQERGSGSLPCRTQMKMFSHFSMVESQDSFADAVLQAQYLYGLIRCEVK